MGRINIVSARSGKLYEPLHRPNLEKFPGAGNARPRLTRC